MIVNMSGAEAIKKGLVTEAEWEEAWRHPWSWTQAIGGYRVRYRPWNGLDVDMGENRDE